MNEFKDELCTTHWTKQEISAYKIYTLNKLSVYILELGKRVKMEYGIALEWKVPNNILCSGHLDSAFNIVFTEPYKLEKVHRLVKNF